MIYPTVTPRGATSGLPLPRLDEYQHELAHIGGYRSATFSFTAVLGTAIRWANDGLAASVICKNERGDVTFEGFVNNVTISAPNVERELGPVLNMANELAVSYSTPTYAGLQKAYQKQTDFYYDIDSIDKYGLLTEVASGGERTEAAADIYANRLLNEKAFPQVMDTTRRGSIGYTISVQCAGWSRILERTVYRYTADTKKHTLYDKLNTILDRTELGRRVPGGITRQIATVQIEIDGYEDNNPTGWTAITKSIEDAGLDTETERAVVGIIEGRVFDLHIASPDTNRYTFDVDTGRFMRGGNYVPNSLVTPGAYVESGFLFENVLYFVESASYRMSDDSVSTNRSRRSMRGALKQIYGA